MSSAEVASEKLKGSIARESRACSAAADAAVGLKRVAIRRTRQAASAADVLRRVRAALAAQRPGADPADVKQAYEGYRTALVDLVGCVERVVGVCDARARTAEALVRKYDALAAEVEEVRRAAMEERARAAASRARRVGRLIANPFAAENRAAKRGDASAAAAAPPEGAPSEPASPR